MAGFNKGLFHKPCAQERGVEVREGAAVAAVQPGSLELADGGCRAFDECLWCTQAAAPAWLQKTGLPLGVPVGVKMNLHPGCLRKVLACFCLPALCLQRRCRSCRQAGMPSGM